MTIEAALNEEPHTTVVNKNDYCPMVDKYYY